MGHLAGKDLYRRLGQKIDGLMTRSPWNEVLYSILKELYSEGEARFLIKMPYTLSRVERISRVTGEPITSARAYLEQLAEKGLVLDLYHDGEYYYMPSPLLLGFFEFTMMRLGSSPQVETLGKLFRAYFASGAPYRGNYDPSLSITMARTLPHQEAVFPEEVVEILSYEKAEELIAAQWPVAVGNCSCRHQKLHAGEKTCDVPLETCLSLGRAADYVIRHGMARGISREEALGILQESRDSGLVLSADNVQKRALFICSCCSCCCTILEAVNRFGCTSHLMTSSFMATVDARMCTGCEKCIERCPVHALQMVASEQDETGKERYLPVVDESICLGCGVCALSCNQKALHLKQRPQRIIPPETTFERNVLLCLQNNTLQNMIFDNPEAVTHRVMRGILGAFLKLPPVKQVLMKDAFRSRFLALAAAGVKMQGRGWVCDV